jgi:hypothetical protein
MTEQIIEILKISSLIIFNLFFVILVIISIIFFKFCLKISKLRKNISEDYLEIAATLKSKVSNIDDQTVGLVSGITAGIFHGFKKPKKMNSVFSVGSKIIKTLFR